MAAMDEKRRAVVSQNATRISAASSAVSKDIKGLIDTLSADEESAVVPKEMIMQLLTAASNNLMELSVAAGLLTGLLNNSVTQRSAQANAGLQRMENPHVASRVPTGSASHLGSTSSANVMTSAQLREAKKSRSVSTASTGAANLTPTASNTAASDAGTVNTGFGTPAARRFNGVPASTAGSVSSSRPLTPKELKDRRRAMLQRSPTPMQSLDQLAVKQSPSQSPLAPTPAERASLVEMVEVMDSPQYGDVISAAVVNGDFTADDVKEALKVIRHGMARDPSYSVATEMGTHTGTSNAVGNTYQFAKNYPDYTFVA
jgi:hypothetical protein